VSGERKTQEQGSCLRKGFISRVKCHVKVPTQVGNVGPVKKVRGLFSISWTNRLAGRRKTALGAGPSDRKDTSFEKSSILAWEKSKSTQREGIRD